jgi:uncharacterized protein (TIGR03067 family)
MQMNRRKQRERRGLVSVGVIAAAALSVLAAEPPDNKALQGEWIPIKAELGGKPVPEAVLKTMSLKLGDGTYDVSGDGEPDKRTFEVDVSTRPMGMIIRGRVGPNQGRTIPAIYELEVRICCDLAPSGARRPTEFKSAVGTRLYLVTYQRKTEGAWPQGLPAEQRISDLEAFGNGAPRVSEADAKREHERDLAEILKLGLVERAERDFVAHMPSALVVERRIGYFGDTNVVWFDFRYRLAATNDLEQQEFGYKRKDGANWALIWGVAGQQC